MGSLTSHMTLQKDSLIPQNLSFLVLKNRDNKVYCTMSIIWCWHGARHTVGKWWMSFPFPSLEKPKVPESRLQKAKEKGV